MSKFRCENDKQMNENEQRNETDVTEGDEEKVFLPLDTRGSSVRRQLAAVVC